MSTEGSANGGKKKKNQTVFAVGILVLILICAPYFYYAVQINSYGLAHKPADYVFPRYADMWKTLVGAAVCFVLKELVVFVGYNYAASIAKEQTDPTLKHKYAMKACHKIFTTSYFIVSAFWGWSVLKDTPYLPWYLGGPADGNYKNMTLSSIYTEYSPELLDYSLYTFGYHLGDCLQHVLLDERMNDFEEMLLHHIAAASLYFCYIFGNAIPIGAVIAYLHDLADIPGNLCKALNSTIYQTSSAVVFFVCVIVWFGTRLVSLPSMIYHIFAELRYTGDTAHFQPFIYINGFFLSVMCALHCYWFTLFIKMLKRYYYTGEAKDVQNEV